MFTPNILWHNVASAIKKLHVQWVRPLHNCPRVIVTDIYHFQVSHVRVTEFNIWLHTGALIYWRKLCDQLTMFHCLLIYIKPFPQGALSAHEGEKPRSRGVGKNTMNFEEKGLQLFVRIRYPVNQDTQWKPIELIAVFNWISCCAETLVVFGFESWKDCLLSYTSHCVGSTKLFSGYCVAFG